MITRLNHAVIGTIISVPFLWSVAPLQAQDLPPYLQDQILVKPRLAVELGDFHQQIGTQVIKSFPRIGGVQVVRLPAGLSVEEAIRRFEASGLVWYAVPDRTDYQLATHNVPNDPEQTDGAVWGPRSSAAPLQAQPAFREDRILVKPAVANKQHARTLIEYYKRFKGGPEDPPPPEPGSIVLAGIAWGADRMNRNHLVPGKPEWPWHVAKFVAFVPASVEILDGSPEVVHLSHFRNGYNNRGGIGFWDYTVTAELGPALCLWLSREEGALRFQWTDLSTNAACVGTNYVYTLETRDHVSDEWVPAPGGAWPTRQTQWAQPVGEETTMRLYRVRAELLDDQSWQPVARECQTVFFRVDWISSGGAGPSSYVLPLSKEEDKRHARALIQHLKETPGKPLPEDPGASVIAAVAWGGDGINRNHLVPGKPPWPWHVTEFLGFTPYTRSLEQRRLVTIGTECVHWRIVLEQQECRLLVASEFSGMAVSQDYSKKHGPAQPSGEPAILTPLRI